MAQFSKFCPTLNKLSKKLPNTLTISQKGQNQANPGHTVWIFSRQVGMQVGRYKAKLVEFQFFVLLARIPFREVACLSELTPHLATLLKHKRLHHPAQKEDVTQTDITRRSYAHTYTYIEYVHTFVYISTYLHTYRRTYILQT